MPQPNILFIIVDQMRPDEVGAATPNLAALAERGVRFENAYCASPLCLPSRTSIVTGKFVTQHGVCGNMTDPVGPAERADAYPCHLQRVGYHTVCIGKHHYIDRGKLRVDILEDDDVVREFGYDHVWQVYDIFPSAPNQDRYTRWLAERGRLEAHLGRRKIEFFETVDPAESVDGYIGETAVEYLRQYGCDQPLLLTVGFYGPHPPYIAPGKYARMFDVKDVPPPKGVTEPARVESARRLRAQKLGKVAHIDDCVGRLLEMLDARGMTESTLVVFTSDHGDNIGDHGIFDKRHYYEQSVKVPLILAGPGVTVDERVGNNACCALVSGVDLYPTFLDAAGCEAILGGSPRHGRSLLRLLDDREPPRQEVYGELGTSMMVRDAHWKLVYDAEQGGVLQLFSLRRDPDELENLAGVPAYRAVEADLTEKLLSHMIRLTRTTHNKERFRFQRVRV